MISTIALTMLAGVAIQEAPMMAPPPMQPPPGMNAQFERMHAQMRTTVLGALTPEHRAQAQAIAARFNNGDVSMCQAAEQIGGILSPTESSQVTAAIENMHKSMHPGPMGGHMMIVHRGKPDAGEMVLMATAMP